MKEVEIFQSLNLALISNAIYTLAVYFLLWVSLRAARLAREGEERGGILPKILVTRVRHQMTQVIDSYRARFKLATTKGSTVSDPLTTPFP